MCLYLGARFQVSSIILISFKQGGSGEGVILPHPRPPPPSNEPLKSPPRLELKKTMNPYENQ